eukprot:13190471-Alexandrium_andersonii.AAC.1
MRLACVGSREIERCQRAQGFQVGARGWPLGVQFNSVRVRRAVANVRAPLLPAGSSSNEALRAEINA